MGENHIIICICGMAGSGKSTVAKRIANKYKLAYYSGGDALRELALQTGYSSTENGWWEKPEGMHFLEKRQENLAFDRKIDQKLIKLAQNGNVVLDSRTMPWLLKKSFNIWLEACINVRARRTAERDHVSFKEALIAVKKKEIASKKIYKKLYGFNLGKDFEPFHLILDTNHLTLEEVFHALNLIIAKVYLFSLSHPP